MKLPATIRCIFFDVDGTLFDHDLAQTASLHQVIAEFHPALSAAATDELIAVYALHNARSWNAATINGLNWRAQWVQPFEATLGQLGISGIDVATLARRYCDVYAAQPCPCRHAGESLALLKTRYRLGILSNGYAKVQRTKLRTLALDSHFEHFIFSAEVGASKPSRAIFEAAQQRAACRPEEMLYVGDSLEHDVAGAKAAGWTAVFYNQAAAGSAPGRADFEVKDLMSIADSIGGLSI